MDHRSPESYANLAEVGTEPFNLQRTGGFEIVVHLRRGALRMGAASYWSADGVPHEVSIVGFRITNMRTPDTWPETQGNLVKVMVEGVPSAEVKAGQYIGQDDLISPVLVPSQDRAVRGEDGRAEAERAAHKLRATTGTSVGVVRVDDQQTEDPALMEWGLAFDRLILALKSITYFD